MRIAYTVHKYPPESLGGTEVYTWSLARTLARAGHEIHVFYPLAGMMDGDEQIAQDGVRLWRVRLPDRQQSEGPAAQYWHTFRNAEVEDAFGRFLAETKPELVHFQHVQGASARLISLATGYPRVLTLHDYWYFCANSQLIRPDRALCPGPRMGWNCVDCATARADLQGLRTLRPLVALPFIYRNRYLRKLIDEVDLLVAPSDFLRETYARQGFDRNRIAVLENGLDLERIVAVGDTTLPEPPGRPNFGFLGSLAWQKGVHVLIEAFNSMAPGPALTVFGSDRAFPEYGAHLRALAQHPNIRFLGAIDPGRVGAALRTLDCLVVPSLWYENSPLVIQEAFATGLPVVASRLGALAEKVTDGIDGLLFQTGDPEDLTRVLRELAEAPGLLATLTKGVRPGPTMQEHAEALLSLYRRLHHDGS